MFDLGRWEMSWRFISKLLFNCNEYNGLDSPEGQLCKNLSRGKLYKMNEEMFIYLLYENME